MKQSVLFLSVALVLLFAQQAYAIARAPQSDSASLQPIPEGAVANISASVSSSGTPVYIPSSSSGNTIESGDASPSAQPDDENDATPASEKSTPASSPWILSTIIVLAIVGGTVGYVVYKSRKDLG